MTVEELIKKYHNGEIRIEGASYAGIPQDNTIMYVTEKVGYLLANLKGHMGCVIFAENNISINDDEIIRKNYIVFVENPQYEYAKMATEVDKQRRLKEQKLKYILTNGGYYLGEDTVIGEGSYIEPGCFIGHHVKIGKNAIILSGARITNSIIGDNFVCNENASIGNKAFTMSEDNAGNKYRIPSLGRVIIGDNVEVGACNDISRGACGDTILDDYVKLDGLVHVGHEAHLHKNVEITAGAIIAGFVNIGEHGYLGVNTSIRNRINLGEDCLIGMGAVVTKGVESKMTVVGNPAKLFTKKK